MESWGIAQMASCVMYAALLTRRLKVLCWKRLFRQSGRLSPCTPFQYRLALLWNVMDRNVIFSIYRKFEPIFIPQNVPIFLILLEPSVSNPPFIYHLISGVFVLAAPTLCGPSIIHARELRPRRSPRISSRFRQAFLCVAMLDTGLKIFYISLISMGLCCFCCTVCIFWIIDWFGTKNGCLEF